MPLPPYIASRRAPDDEDRADYQTMFAHDEGSVAAPTAGLHFTDELMARLKARGIACTRDAACRRRDVPAGEDRRHAPITRCMPNGACVDARPRDALNAARRAGGRIVAVGSTSLRLLESAADEDGAIRPFAGETAIFIAPGYASAPST